MIVPVLLAVGVVGVGAWHLYNRSRALPPPGVLPPLPPEAVAAVAAKGGQGHPVETIAAAKGAAALGRHGAARALTKAAVAKVRRWADAKKTAPATAPKALGPAAASRLRYLAARSGAGQASSAELAEGAAVAAAANLPATADALATQADAALAAEPALPSGPPRPAGDPPVVRRGSRGPWVAYLQGLIGASPADGIFGPGTEAAVKAWQASKGLKGDGIVGPQTWGRLAG